MALADMLLRGFTACERENAANLVICGYLFRRSLRGDPGAIRCARTGGV